MSKPAPIYGDSSRLCSPACALLHAPRCLTTFRVAPPVHGVSTTPVTTPQPPSPPADRPGRRSGVPGSATRHPEHQDQRVCPHGITVGTIANIAYCPRWRETGRVDVTDLDADPLCQLATWLDAARGAGQPMPEAMTVASATSDAIPSARLVVLRGLQPGLVFFTDCESDKGAELAANPRAAAVLHWLVPAHRQVRVAGPVERVGEDEADEYWSTRAPAVRPSAAASHQSRVVAGGRSWKCRSRTGCGVTLAEPMFPVRDAGPASGCCPPASSSGRNRRTACTTGSATAGEAVAGSSSGCRRNAFAG
jgi:pyridoxine/pyridoxamine 5'-phosphate oxidase